MMRMEISFPGKLKVDATFRDFVVKTDQPEKYGGDNSAPEPFEFFLASLATCAGFYVKAFCMKRGISTDGMKIIQEVEPSPQRGLLSKIKLEIFVPQDFPEQYKNALINSADICTVKKVIQNPPEFEITVEST
jgi:putative redox protein